MSYRHTLEAALESLKEIEDLVKGFPGDGMIPSVDIDLALQKIRNIYELMLMMKKESSVAAAVAVEKKPQNEKKPAAVSSVKMETAEAATATVVEEPAAEKKPAAASTIEEKAATGGKTSTSKDAQTLADQFKGEPTLHESLHQTYSKDETLAHGIPVNNIMDAIGINDRFTFIRELFNGETAKYESAIKFLNDAGTFNDAYNYMILYFNWDMDSEPVKLLLDIIRRKFIKGRHE